MRWYKKLSIYLIQLALLSSPRIEYFSYNQKVEVGLFLDSASVTVLFPSLWTKRGHHSCNNVME